MTLKIFRILKIWGEHYHRDAWKEARCLELSQAWWSQSCCKEDIESPCKAERSAHMIHALTSCPGFRPQMNDLCRLSLRLFCFTSHLLRFPGLSVYVIYWIMTVAFHETMTWATSHISSHMFMSSHIHAHMHIYYYVWVCESESVSRSVMSLWPQGL